jgi:PST family polysaccharide transporter
VFSYAISFVGIFSIIASFGIDQVLLRELVKYPEKNNEYLGTAFFIKLFFGITALVLTLIFTSIFNAGEVLINTAIFIIATSFIFQAFSVINVHFQSQVRSKKVMITAMIIGITIGLGKILVIFLQQGVLYLSLILLCESILTALFLIIIFIKERNIFDWQFKYNVAKEIIIDSWPFIFAGAFAFIYARIDQIMIQNLIDTRSVGIYDAAVRLTEVWYLIPNILAVSLFPALINAQENKKRYFKRIKLFSVCMLGTSLFLAIGLILSSHIIIPIMYGLEFSDSVIILQIYSLSLIGTFLGHLMNNYLLSENNKKMIFINSLIAMITNVLLNIILIPRIGIAGAAIATVISYSLITIVPFVSKKIRSDFKMVLRS